MKEAFGITRRTSRFKPTRGDINEDESEIGLFSGPFSAERRPEHRFQDRFQEILRPEHRFQDRFQEILGPEHSE